MTLFGTFLAALAGLAVAIIWLFIKAPSDTVGREKDS